MKSIIKLLGPQIAEGLEKLSKIEEFLKTESPELGSKLFFSGEAVIGEVDFYFEWKNEPTQSDIIALISVIDDKMKDVKTHYTIATEQKKSLQSRAMAA